MESLFITNIKNTVTKDLVTDILTLFNNLQEKDSELAILLVQFLEKHLKKESVSVNVLTLTKSTQTDCNDSNNGWDMKDITKEVKQVAEQCMSQTGLNYDKSSGTYYNSEEGYYYIPDYRLYYYPRLSAYYYYDDTSDSLKYHSSVATPNTASTTTNENSTASISYQIQNSENDNSSAKVTNRDKEHCIYSELLTRRKIREDKEEGELSSSDEENEQILEEESRTKVIFESGPKAFEPDHSKHNAPCMRMIITKTALENFTIGTLFLITRDGGTLGREGIHHEILLPDCNVSKDHLKIQYVYKGDTEQRYAYEVIDLGSRNGTFVNGERLSTSNEISQPKEICHGTIVTIGCTTFLCHIHKDMDFCNECRPIETSLLKESSNIERPLSSKQQHHLQMMQMKYKYQLNSLTGDNVLPKGYTDRAKARRETVGSSHGSEKTEVSSVHVPMNKNNKGYNLLSKMGWKEGDNLGKNASTSFQEPLYVEPKFDKSGFGAE